MNEIKKESNCMDYCQRCGLKKRNEYIFLEQNIGLFIRRDYSNINAHLCRECAKYFYIRFTLTTLFLGWWGIISFFYTPVILFGNTYSYIKYLKVIKR